MKITLNKIAAVIAFVIGMMAVFAGGQVLLGKTPGYYVINWLPVYNYTIGLITVFTTAILIWNNSRLALPVALATFTTHAGVMLVLRTVFRGEVALDSLVAMTVRLAAWVVILVLMFFQLRKTKVAHP